MKLLSEDVRGKVRNYRARFRLRCEVCEREFFASRRHATTCSEACKSKGYRNRKAKAAEVSGPATSERIPEPIPGDVFCVELPLGEPVCFLVQ